MHISKQMTSEEKIVANKIDRYFKNHNMSLRDKVFNALLITQYELEAQYFSNEREKEKIIHFKMTLDRLLEKLSD